MSILHTAYLPPIAWFAQAQTEQKITLEAHEHYQKGSERNRCWIAGPNGPQLLSIPLEKGKHQQTPVREVRIAYQNAWPTVHWRSIQTAYGNAPYFEYYQRDLWKIYQSKPVFLWDFNLQLLEWVLAKAGWNWSIAHTDTYQAVTPLPKGYTAPRYAQVFEDRHGFLPNLSILDALMCCGKRIPL